MPESPLDKSQNANARVPETPRVTPSNQPIWRRRWWIVPIVIAAIFLAGCLPMWFKAARLAGERDMAHREIKLLKLENLIAAATIDARRGEYESARQGAARFFSALWLEVDLGLQSALTQAQQEPLKALLVHRDDLITLLARSDPACAERLTELYLACRKSLRGKTPSDGNAAQPSRP
jgi:hypothetical protein